jgi:hypothetical protein
MTLTRIDGNIARGPANAAEATPPVISVIAEISFSWSRASRTMHERIISIHPDDVK